MQHRARWLGTGGALLGVLAAVSVLVVLVRGTVASRTAKAAAPPAPSGSAAPSASSDTGFVGVLIPPSTVNLAARVDGILAHVDVEMGRAVREGDVVASLDTRLQRRDLEMARAGYGAAQAARSAARVEAERARDHVARRQDTTIVLDDRRVAIVSGEEAAQAKFDEQGAAAKLWSSVATATREERRVEQMATLLAEHDLRAPFDGVVAARFQDPGAYVKAGDPVVRIVATGGMFVRFAVPEPRASGLANGDAVTVVLDDRSLAGAVARVAPEVEPASRTVFVEATFREPGDVCARGCAGLAGRAVRVREEKH